ncbi:MAG TPA: hypothetical protein VGM72_03900 [Micropepsaceae bacterium]|jgi:mono/diheme cytochrome c family protein
MRDFALYAALGAAVFIAPAMAQEAGTAGQNPSQESAIRAGHEIALESCTGCHVASPQQEFRPVTGDAIPSFEDIANRPGVSVVSLREALDRTHRNKDAPQRTSISTTTSISDVEASEVIAYILTQKRAP